MSHLIISSISIIGLYLIIHCTHNVSSRLILHLYQLSFKPKMKEPQQTKISSSVQRKLKNCEKDRLKLIVPTTKITRESLDRFQKTLSISYINFMY